MRTWDSLASLPVSIDGYSLTPLSQPLGPEFTRECTLITLQGGGEEGVGEDVVYDALDHIAFRDEGPVLDLSGPATLGELSELMDELDLFPSAPPVRDFSRLYRRWAFESAALDLALRQAGTSLHAIVAAGLSSAHVFRSERTVSYPELVASSPTFSVAVKT